MISHIVNKRNLETESYYKLGELQKGGSGFKIIIAIKGGVYQFHSIRKCLMQHRRSIRRRVKQTNHILRLKKLHIFLMYISQNISQKGGDFSEQKYSKRD